MKTTKILKLSFIGIIFFMLIGCKFNDDSNNNNGGDNSSSGQKYIITSDKNITSSDMNFKTVNAYDTFENRATLNVNGINLYAMKANKNYSKVINGLTGTININGISGGALTTDSTSSYAMAINYGKININRTNSTQAVFGIYVRGKNSVGTNATGGKISITGYGSSYITIGMKSDDASSLILNYGDIGNTQNSDGSMAGMQSDGTAINYGNIIFYATGLDYRIYGMMTTSGKLVNEKYGVISLLGVGNNTESFGIYSDGPNSRILNYGTINNSTDFIGTVTGISTEGIAINSGNISLNLKSGGVNNNASIKGMEAKNNGKIINARDGVIKINSVNKDNLSAGMSVTTGVAENYGIIYVSGANVHGMSSINGQPVILKNMETGVIYVHSNGVLDADKNFYGSSGIKADSNSAQVYNYGRIEVSGENGYGINVEGANAKVYLGGKSVIKIMAGTKNSTALKLSGGATVTLVDENLDSEIEIDSGAGTGNNKCEGVPTATCPTSVAIYGSGGTNVTLDGTNLISDENGNRAFVIENRATIVSQKKMIVNKNFDVADFGDGKFVMGYYGSLVAPKVSGEIYLAPDIVGLYQNYGVTPTAFTTNLEKDYDGWFNANLKSSSAFYEVEDYAYGNDGKSVSVTLKRKSFDTVLSDKNLAKYLEDNYTNTYSLNKDKFYNGILREDLTAAKAEEKIKNLFGVDFYPAYQNLIYDLTAYNSKLIFDNYSNLDYEKQGMNPIIGV
ncbi:MAG: hypothetical protein ACRCSK_01020, partial [Fusobacteriaceae bacterium]